MEPTVVAVAAETIPYLTQLGPDEAVLVEWDGTSDPPRDDIELWVGSHFASARPQLVAQHIEALPRLKVIQSMAAGVDPWIPLVPPTVQLCSGKTIHGGSTAEMAVTLLLALVRNVPRYVRQQDAAEWKRIAPDTLIDKQVVVLGAGDIGSRIAATLETLEADVTLAARTPRDGVVSLQQARDLAPHTDALVLAVPLTDETRQVIGKEWLAALPDGAIVVNIARGPVVDTDALLAEVQAGRLRAGLDVTDPEPLPVDHPLWHAPGVLLTPHVGGGATGTQRRAARLVVEQLRRFRAGEPLKYLVTKGY